MRIRCGSIRQLVLLDTAITGNISKIGNPPSLPNTHMSLLQSSSFKVTNQTLHKTALPGENYVLSLTQIANLYAASASSPSNQIYLFDRATLQTTGVLKGHEHATTQLCTIHGLGASTREMLLSAGKDGCVMAWDERSGSASIKSASSVFASPDNMHLYNSETSFDTSGNVRETTSPSLLRCVV